MISSEFDFPQREVALIASAEKDLPLLPLARGMVEFTAQLLHQVPETDVSDPPTGAQCRKIATYQLAALCLRSSCAVTSLVLSGYETESHALKRRASECVDRVIAITKDTSGEAARQWLEGRGRSPRSLAQRHGLVEAWDLYSQNTHATSFSVVNLWDPPAHIPVEPHHRRLLLAPTRNTFRANALLFDCAYELGLLDAGLAEVYAGAILIPPTLSEAMHDGRRWLEERRPRPRS